MKQRFLLTSLNEYYIFKLFEVDDYQTYAIEKTAYDKIFTIENVNKYGPTRNWPEEFKVEGLRIGIVGSEQFRDLYDIIKGFPPRELQFNRLEGEFVYTPPQYFNS